MAADPSPKIVIVDESPIRAAILQEGLREAGFAGVTHISEMHNLLAETVAIPEARKWILDNQVVPNQVGLGLVDEIKGYLEGLTPRAP